MFSLFAIVLGSFLGVFIFVLFLNHSEKNNFYLAHVSSFEDFARHFNVILPDGEHENETDNENVSLILKVKLVLRRCCNNFKVFALKAVYRLINSPMIKDQIGSSTAADIGSARNLSIYELIHPYGQTPEEMLASAYGPTAVGHSANAICVSKKIDEIMHKVFEYTYRDYVEIW